MYPIQGIAAGPWVGAWALQGLASVKLTYCLACPRVRACRRFASYPVLRVEVFFADPVERELEFLRRGESRGFSLSTHHTSDHSEVN